MPEHPPEEGRRILALRPSPLGERKQRSVVNIDSERITQ